jgi:hypothetical protein
MKFEQDRHTEDERVLTLTCSGFEGFAAMTTDLP